jgi:hypothetical protein
VRIVYIRAGYADQRNSIDHRLSTLCRAIVKTGLHQAEQLDASGFIQDTDPARSICMAADIIVIPAVVLGESLSVISRWKARDKIMLVDLYDLPANALEYLQTENSGTRANKPSWIKSDTSPLDFFHWGLRIVDGVIVHSRNHVDLIRAYSKVFFIPEFVDLDMLLNITPIAQGKIVIGLQKERECDQEMRSTGLIEALGRVCELRPNVAVHIWDETLTPVRPIPSLRYLNLRDNHLPDYAEAHPLAFVNIGLTLLCTHSDELRGWKKILDYMAVKIPWAATDHPALRELRPYGWLVQNTATVWERVILDMVDHLNAYQEEASQEAFLYAISQGIEENVDKILSTYSMIKHTI